MERICREALEQPDRHAALRALRDSLPALESELGGIRNEGFLATHELRVGARQRPDWREAGEGARRTLGKRGRDLLTGLGFQIEPFDRVTSILRAGERKVALAVLLERHESPELPAERFSSLSPVSYALAVADRENLPYVVIQHGAKVRIHPTRVGSTSRSCRASRRGSWSRAASRNRARRTSPTPTKWRSRCSSGSSSSPTPRTRTCFRTAGTASASAAR